MPIAAFRQLLVQSLAERSGCPDDAARLQLDVDTQWISPALTLHSTGPKSLVFSDRRASVIKVYLSGPSRDLEKIAESYQQAWRENPEIFPETVVAGRARMESHELLILWQRYVHGSFPDYDFKPEQWDRLLARWDSFSARHRQPLPESLRSLIEGRHASDPAAHRKISEIYRDAFAAYQATFGYRRLQERREFSAFPKLSLLEPPLDSVTQIIGDISPKHILVEGDALAFDLEKYGLGDPAKDLSTIVRFYLYRDDLANAERLMGYLRERYGRPELVYRVYLATLGSGSRLLQDTQSQPALDRYRKVLNFFPRARKCFDE
jgi:hypothetical protein